MSSWDFAKYMVKEHKLALLPGSIFGENGEGFARLSFATSSRNIETALKKLQKGIAGI
jgi:aspartate/methionine/tyrosine aminotransferase